MLIETISQAFRKARSVNQTSNGYVSKVPTVTEPVVDAATATGQASIDLGGGGVGQVASGAPSQNAVIIIPYATASNNGTFSFRAIGWRRVGNDPTTWLWVPVDLGEWLCTVSSSCPGVAGKTIVATEFFVDTITIVGTVGGNNALGINSPANDTIGYIVINLLGFQRLELSFTTGGSATDCNALVALL